MQHNLILYTGTKSLLACPMARNAYNLYRGWDTPEFENPEDEGYLVEYTDGGKSNDSRHAGYISWSPKDVFERSYKAVKPPRYALPHQQRVYEEYRQLRSRLTALRAFLDSDTYGTLTDDEQTDLLTQEGLMNLLSMTLVRRISRF